MQPINQTVTTTVTKTDTKANAIFRLPNTVVGAPAQLLEGLIKEGQFTQHIDALKNNSSPFANVEYYQTTVTTTTTTGGTNSGTSGDTNTGSNAGSNTNDNTYTVLSMVVDKSTLQANDILGVTVITDSQSIKWTFEGIDASQINVSAQATDTAGQVLINFSLKDPSIIKQNTIFKINAVDDAKKQKGSVIVSITPVSNTKLHPGWVINQMPQALTSTDFDSKGLNFISREDGSYGYGDVIAISDLNLSDFNIYYNANKDSVTNVTPKKTGLITNTKTVTLTVKKEDDVRQLPFTVNVDTTTASKYKVQFNKDSYESDDSIRVTIYPESTYNISGIDQSLYDISTYQGSDGGTFYTDIYIQPKTGTPEQISKDTSLTITATGTGALSGDTSSTTIKKYVDKSYNNTVSNKEYIKGHVDTYKDISDQAHLTNDEKSSGPFTVKVNDKEVGTFNNLEDIKIDGVTTYWYSNYEHVFINNTNEYKTIDIISTKSVDLRYNPTGYDDVNELVNTTYDGDKTNTIYLAPSRANYDSSVEDTKKNRASNNVVRLNETTDDAPPYHRATLIINDKYAYVDENFSGNFSTLLNKANMFIAPQESSGLIAIYNKPDIGKNIDVKLIVSDKRNPVQSGNAIIYDPNLNITSFFFPSGNSI